MQEVITWTVIGGCLVFGLGLISAFQARRQNQPGLQGHSEVPRAGANSPIGQPEIQSSMDMAAKGVANGGEGFASIIGTSR